MVDRINNKTRLKELLERANPSWSYNKNKIDLKKLLKFCDKKIDVKTQWILDNVRFLNVSDSERIKQANLNVPIVLLKIEGRFKILDGNHRLAKAKKEDIEEIPAYIISIESLPNNIKEIFS